MDCARKCNLNVLVCVHLFQVIINYRDLFQAPTFDELEQVASDGFGDLKKLSPEQLQSVWDSGYWN